MNDKEEDAFLKDLYFNKNFKYGRDKIFRHISKSLENKDISVKEQLKSRESSARDLYAPH
jgi:hypothetical protein